MMITIDGSDIRRLVVNGRVFDVGPEGYLAAISEVAAPEDIEGIAVVQGPGSATALRASLAIANTLAMTLGVPLCDAAGQPHAYLEPVYENEARITPSTKDQLRRKT